MSVSRHQLNQARKGAVVLYNLCEIGRVVESHYDKLLVEIPGVYINVIVEIPQEEVRGVSLHGLSVYLSLPPPSLLEAKLVATIGGIHPRNVSEDDNNQPRTG